jgi:ubiquitin carboxyl-terminal hydrolase 14
MAKAVPENPNNAQERLSSAFGALLTQMDKTVEPVTPMAFTQLMRMNFPQFAERDQKGHFMQQDAEECVNQLLSCFSTVKNPETQQPVVQELFLGRFTSTETCTENEAEPDVVSSEAMHKLTCYITQDVNYLNEGILLSLESNRTKNSPTLGRNAEYKKTLRISALPKILIVHFNRFGWKQGQKQGLKTKKLRKVAYPETLDLSPFCDAKLGRDLRASVMKLKQEQNKVLGLGKYAVQTPEQLKEAAVKKAKVEVAASTSATSSAEAKSTNSVIEVGMDDDITLPEGMVSSGNYELFAVITHQGRTADSGHYVGWTRQKGDKWLKFDDAVVSPVTTADIMELCGGGDWPMSYVNLYRRKDNLRNKVWDV